jgi:hypothetical protein
MTAVHRVSRLLAAAFVLAAASSAFAADDGAWTVSKSSGEVWFLGTGAEPASLKPEETLKPGDTVRTGRTGRVLLQRGEETILISPNSVVGLPVEKKDGLATTIMQRAGSILLDVEKRNVKHFEVETPYLAAVVKGTQFRVTVNAASTSVEVTRGQVEVADFRSGQIAQVMPGQHATTFTQGKAGLALGGSGTFNPIEQGKPRAPSIERVPVPKTGLTAPRNAAIGQMQRQAGTISAKPGVTRISSSIGEVRLNFHRVTHGLAREKSSTSGAARSTANKDTIWSSSTSGTTAATTTAVTTGNGTSSNASSATAASVSSVTTTVAVVTGSGTSSGNGSGGGSTGTGSTGNGNSGNGNNANDNEHGNRHGHGHDNRIVNNNDNNGNGNNGNNGNGNGHGKGH